MTWYAAHIIIGLKSEDPKIDIFAYENIVLIKAESHDEAKTIADEIGREDSSIEDGLTIGNVVAKRVFAGVRKVVSISNYEGSQDQDSPSHRTEISYSEYRLGSMDDLIKLGSGNEVHLEYVD